MRIGAVLPTHRGQRSVLQSVHIFITLASNSLPPILAGAIAGMVGGAATVFLWKLVISGLGGIFAIYELLPAFIVSSICIVAVSLMTVPPSKDIEQDFEAVKQKTAE